MTLIFDYITAVLLSMGIFIALVGTQVRVQQTGIEQVSAHAAKTKALSLGQWLEADITSLGANFGDNLLRFELPESDDAGNTLEWVFYSDSLRAGGAVDRYVTRYTLTTVDEIVTGGVTRPLFQLTRETASTPVVDGVAQPIGAGDWRGDGRSVATLSRFQIGLRAREGQPTSNVEAADYIRVEFALVPEFERHRSYLQELYWTTMLKVRPFWQQSDSETSQLF